LSLKNHQNIFNEQIFGQSTFLWLTKIAKAQVHLRTHLLE